MGLRIFSMLALLVAVAGCGGSSEGSSGGGGGGTAATTVDFSTYLGKDGADFVRDVMVDSAGNVYAVGGTRSTDLPTSSGSLQPNFGGLEDAFAAKFNDQGRLLWSTYLGGTSLDRAYAGELDPQGNVVIAGRAGTGFPVTPGAFQTQFVGGASDNVYPEQDGYVAKISADGQRLLWATYFGASDCVGCIIRDIAIDPVTGAIFLVYATDTGAFPASYATAFQAGEIPNRIGGTDGVVAKLSSDGTQLEWATYLGGTGDEDGSPSVRIDSQGNVFAVYGTRSTNAPTTSGAADRTPNGGVDLYLAKYDGDGNFLAATFLGGSSNDLLETHNLVVRSDRTVVVGASSLSTDYPTTPGAFDTSHNGNGGNGTGGGSNYPGDCAITILDGSLARIEASTFYGGRFGEACEGVGADGQGNVYVAGGAYSDDLPTSNGAYQRTRPATLSPFTAVFSRDLAKLRYGTYYGGNSSSSARTLTVHGEAHWVFGGSAGTNYPLQNAVRSNVSSGSNHGAVTDLQATLGPG